MDTSVTFLLEQKSNQKIQEGFKHALPPHQQNPSGPYPL
jgi:hypothetical protein